MSVSLFGRTVAGERVVVLARRRRMRVVQKLLPEGFIKEKKFCKNVQLVLSFNQDL